MAVAWRPSVCAATGAAFLALAGAPRRLIFPVAAHKNAAMPGYGRGCIRALVLTVGVASGLGCLPAGEAPKGRQLIADRAVSGAFFSPSGLDPARSHLLVGGPARTSSVIEFSGGWYTTMLSDLYLVDVSDAAASPIRLDQRVPAVRNLNGAAIDMLFGDLPRDSRGRLLLHTLDVEASSGQPVIAVDRFDPDAHVTDRLVAYDAGTGSGTVSFSVGHTRALLYDPPSGSLLVELDGQQVIDSLTATFVGEDVYYVVGGRAKPLSTPGPSKLVRIPPGGASESLLESEGYISMEVIQSDEGNLLILRTQSGTSSPLAYLLDPATLALAPLPFDITSLSFDSLSPDGRWLLFSAYLDGKWLLYDRSTGQTRSLPGALPDAGPTTAAWRPGTDQLWLGANGGLTLWSPDASVTLQGTPTTSCLGDFRYRSSIFNRDGSLWFSAEWSGGGSRMAVGLSDAPETPARPIHPDGTWVNRCWELDGHRLLVEARVGDSQDTDLYLFDPASGEIRALAGSSQVVQAGRERMLGFLQWEGWRSAGELALVDYATGARTHLADDVIQAVVDGPGGDLLSGADPLAPGRHVAFISRNRMDSPYDGLWLTELP